MTWTVAHPILYFLPLVVCLVIHGFLSAGFILAVRKGFFRCFMYLVSCWFVVLYLLILNHGLTLTATKISLDFPAKMISYENNYGIIRIPAEQIQAIVVEGQEARPSTIWVQSERQVFYIDQDFFRVEEFFPLLQSVLDLEEPQLSGQGAIYRAATYSGPVDLKPTQNTLRGNLRFYWPGLLIFPCFAYFLGARGWLGRIRCFQLLGVIYCLPMLGLGLFYPLTLPQAGFLLCYPLYPAFLSAMCLPDDKIKE